MTLPPRLRRWPDLLLLAALLLPVLPVLPQLREPWMDQGTFGELMRHTGEWAAKLLVAALLVAPLQRLWPRARVVKLLRRRRRWLGVAAFAYALLHLGLILLWRLPQLWAVITPWQQLLGLAGLLALLPPALTSLDRAQRALGPTRWRRWQRWTWLAVGLAWAHWAFQGGDALGPASLHVGLVLAARALAWAWLRWGRGLSPGRARLRPA